jgi:hypothetical protein
MPSNTDPARGDADAQRKRASMPPMCKPDGTTPGGRAALPPGSLPDPYFGPQGDEQRDPPANAPAPVSPAPVVENEAEAKPPHSAVP